MTVIDEPARGAAPATFSLSYRWVVAAVYGVSALIAAAALHLSLAKIDADVVTIAHERGATLFRLIELTREWNALHGGVYVPVTEATQPNPYLPLPRRDITTDDGRRLTLVNPAFMTRQLAELAEKADGAQFHITSLKPIRPANKPDAWEAETLASFDKARAGERLSFFPDGGGLVAGPAHRFMAPLLVKPACLSCHASQGYKVGDVRGGISVTMPAAGLVAIAGQRRAQAGLLYALGFVLVAGLGHLVVLRTRRHQAALEAVNRSQETVIAERTRDLHATNLALEREVSEVHAAQRGLAEAQARYRAVVETSASGVVVVENGRVTFVNERMVQIMGGPEARLRAMELTQWALPEDRTWFDERLRERRQSQAAPGDGRVRLLGCDGTTVVHADVQLRWHHDEAGGSMLVASFVDVTDRLEAEKERLISAAVFTSAAEGIVVTDADNRILRVNPAFTAITGYHSNELIGRNPRVLKSGRHDATFYDRMWRHLAEFGRWEGEIWNRRKNDELYAAWVSITTIAGDAGQARYVATSIDITRRKEAEEIILQRANFDALTGLPNRSLFDDRLSRLLTASRRHGRSFALMYLDLDHFKQINDRFGHAAGDALLAEAARRMLACVRETDTVARLGGDEFTVIVAELAHPGDAEEVAGRINAVLAQPFELAEGQGQVSASIGIALYPQHGDDEHVLRRLADQALYASKAAGRNTCRLATPVAG